VSLLVGAPALAAEASGEFDGEWSGRFIEAPTVSCASGRNTGVEVRIEKGQISVTRIQFANYLRFESPVQRDGSIDSWGEWFLIEPALTAGHNTAPLRVHLKGRFSASTFDGRLITSGKQTWVPCYGDLVLRRGAGFETADINVLRGEASAQPATVQELAKRTPEAERKETSESKTEPKGIDRKLNQKMMVLKSLKDGGLISEDEFVANKSALLEQFLGLKGTVP
jgi:hypothetical protein